MIAHEAIEVATTQIREQARSRCTGHIQRHQQLGLGVYVGPLLLRLGDFALNFDRSPILSNDSFSCSLAWTKLEDGESLFQVESALSWFCRRGKARKQNDFDGFEAW